MRGKLYLCATPIGNLGDISERLVKTLNMVDIIAAEDTRHTKKLLSHLGISKPLISYFEHNKKEKGQILIDKLLDGKNIALVSDAGTPAISDSGEELVALCANEGIDVVPIPGPVAAICALIVSGLSTNRFTFEGFLPVNKRGRLKRLGQIKNDTKTLIFYEAPHKLVNTLSDMLTHLGDRKIAVCREMTKLHEEVKRCTVSQALNFYKEQPPRGEFVLVLEGAIEENLPTFEDLTLSEHVQLYMKEGLSEKEAIKKAAKDRGLQKREVYNKIKT